MADSDIWLRSVPSDANPNDFRLYTKPDTGASPGAIAGTASLVFGQTGVLRGAGRLIGSNGLVFGQTGVLRGSGRLIGTNGLVFGQTGNLKGSGRLIGSAPVVFGQTGNLKGAGRLIGTTPVVFGQTGNLKGSGRLIGTTPIVFGQTGTLINSTPGGAIAGTTAIVFGQSGRITGTQSQTVTGGWPIYYGRKKRVPRETLLQEAAPSEITQAVIELEQQILARRELRRKERRDAYVTSQLKAIYAEQDALIAGIQELKQEIEDDDDLALILSLVS